MNMTAADESRLLVLDDVHAAYGKKQILRGVSLSISSGEIVALLGGNGSGKSTLLKTIAGVLSSTHGKVLLNGADLSRSAVNARQKMGIGYLIQGGRVFPNLSVAENFSLARANARHMPAVKSPGLGDIFPTLIKRRSDRAGLLSGGQRQMLAIEMVLSQNPTIALLDEPSIGLTTSLVHEILDSIARVVTARALAVLLVEQNVPEAKRISTRLLRLDCGKVSPQLSADAQPSRHKDDPQ